MMTDDTNALLRDFSRSRSEEAFRTLVRQHSSVVYGTALRKLGGNRAAAQDVTQEVFTLLARKADRLGSVVLGGWLYRQTCRRAANHVRTETRRKQRESLAMENLSTSTAPDVDESLAGELDDALLALPEKDRDALILRFFEGKEFRSLGITLGLSEEAARKRVTRALERLAGNLRRKGIAVGGVSLGTAMQSLGATPVPVAVISVVSQTALKAAGASGSTLFLAWVKPAIAGVAVTSVAAGSTLALRTPDEGNPSVKVGHSPIPSRSQRSSRFAEKLPEDPTLEQIIAEIRRIRSSPGNLITQLRLKVTLGKIKVAQIPEFITLGNERLNQVERAEIYQPLLTLWWDQDPEAAITFILREKIDGKIKSGGSHYLVGELFRRWSGRDRLASEAWLKRNWDDETLRKKFGGGAFRNFLSMWITGELFSRGDVDGVFAFSSRLPTINDQAQALGNVVGMAPMHSRWTYAEENKELWQEFYRGLERFPDDHWRRELTRNFWKNLGEYHPDTALRIQQSFQPADPFAASLGLLTVKQLYGKPKQTLSGGTSMKPNPVEDRALREAATMETGLAQGMNRAEVLTTMGEVLWDGMEPEEYFAWVDTHRSELELDAFFADKARENGNDRLSLGGPQVEAIRWASRIADAELRRSLCRAAFRRMLVRGPEITKEYLESEGLPDDVAAELHQIAAEIP